MVNTPAVGLKMKLSDILDAAEGVKIVPNAAVTYTEHGKIVASHDASYLEWSYNCKTHDGIDLPTGSLVYIVNERRCQVLVFDNTVPWNVIDAKVVITTRGGMDCVLYLYGEYGRGAFTKKDFDRYWKTNDSPDPYQEHNATIK